MSKVKIKNTSTYQVSIILDNVRYRRDLKPGQTTTLPDEAVVEEFNYDTGCRNYVKSGFLQVITDDESVIEALPEAPADIELDVYALLTKGTVSQLEAALRTGSPALKERVIDVAIKNSIVDAARVMLIKKYCDVDVLQALNIQRAM